MPCIPIPKPPLPHLPAGISLNFPVPPLPSITVATPCCLLPPLVTPTIPNPLPPFAVNPGVVTALRVATELIEAWADSIPLDCPRS